MPDPATLTPSESPVYHPLDRLRGRIRRFVLFDGLLIAGLLLVVGFWLGLAADYGLFRLTSFDWVQDTPWALRACTLAAAVVLLACIILWRIVLRLNREFSYPALALVLEKRFPALLGDRLITAVELADVRSMARYGYSEEMIRQTILEAQSRVAEVPVDSVFNWPRLWKKAIWLGVLAIGLLVLSLAIAFAISPTPRHAIRKVSDVATIWAERNLLLWNTPWPRQAHLELLDFPGQERRIGKDTPSLTLRVRAVQWVVSDPSTREGWRAARTSDLATLADLTTTSDLATLVSASAQDDPWLDDLLAEPEHAELGTHLEELAQQPAMSRTLRKLAIPDTVTLSYRGEKTAGTVSFTRDPSGIFTADVTGLKESVRFVIRGGDFTTAPRQITLLPPPMLIELYHSDDQPAYLYHPAPLIGNDLASLRPDWNALKSLRQRFADKPLSLTGEKSVFSVMAGSEVEITGVVDKPLKAVKLQFKPAPGHTEAPEPVAIPVEQNRFHISFRGDQKITQSVEFTVTLIDPDDVTSTRGFLIQAIEDQAPQVEVAVDILRRQGNTFLCTPMAMVPFLRDSVVRDDTGLSQVEFEYTISKVEAEAVVALQAQAAAALWAFAPVTAYLGDALTPTVALATVGLLTKADKKEFGRSPVLRFVAEYSRLPKYTLETLQRRLRQPVDPDHPDVVKQIQFQDPELDSFDLERVLPQLRVGASGEIQPRYRIELNVLASDANYESGPKTARNVELIRLMVISEQDLLAEISKDEEVQIAKMDDLIKKLETAQGKFLQAADRLLSPSPEILVSASVRTLDVLQDLGKARDATQSVVTEYIRLRREAEFNRCNRAVIDKWNDVILTPLPRILENEFPAAEQTLTAVQSSLASGVRPDDISLDNARTALTVLIAELRKVREKQGDVVNINKLRDDLRKIIEDQQQVSTALERIKKGIISSLFNPKLLPGPALVLAKGEKRTITQQINWNAYVEGSLTIKLQAQPGSDLQLPAQVIAQDDRDDFSFELTAGQKAGEFTITLTPAVGEPLLLKVTVK